MLRLVELFSMALLWCLATTNAEVGTILEE